MLNQFEDMIINTIVQKLNSQGLNIDAETVKKAVANSPQVIQQIEEILSSPNTKDKLEKITLLLKQASGETKTTT